LEVNDLDRELEAALAALRDEALPESALASVRAGVRTRILAGRRKRVWTTWLSLAAAAAAMWVAVSIPWSVAMLPLAPPRSPEVASIAVTRPAIGPKRGSATVSLNAAAREAMPRTAAIKRVRRDVDNPPSEAPREERTQFMRIITDDPNVVILWAMNSKGETR
jgi:hypothetical protein